MLLSDQPIISRIDAARFVIFAAATLCHLPQLLGSTIAERNSQVIYVDLDAAGSEDGSSWENAYTSLESALEAAPDSVDVWVAEGTYVLPADSPRQRSFELKPGMFLFGGFDGSESSVEEREPLSHPSVLSGDIGVPGDSSDNSLSVVVAGPDLGILCIDGFTITGGNGGRPAAIFDQGGGVFNTGNQLTVSNCILHDNTAEEGGAIGSGGGEITIVGCMIFQNSAKDGGAIFSFGDNLTIRDSAILDNVATDSGGGVFGFRSDILIERSRICNNRALIPQISNSGGGGGGGVLSATTGGIGRVDIVDSTISGNSAESGGGISGSIVRFSDSTCRKNLATRFGGGIRATFLLVERSSLSGNRSNINGGAIDSFTATIRESKIWGNSAGENGGAVCSSISLTVQEESDIRGNQSGIRGGGIYSEGDVEITSSRVTENQAAESGGGLYQTGNSTSISASTFLLNRAQENGGGIFFLNGTSSIDSSAIVRCTANGDGGGIYVDGSSSTVTLTRSTAGQCRAGSEGGGINLHRGRLIFEESTAVDNSADAGGGIYSEFRFEARRSIIARNNAVAQGNDLLIARDSEAVVFAENFIGIIDDVGIPLPPDILSGEPGLAPLGYYGGTTQTAPPIEGSAVIDRFSPDAGSGSTADQRGLPRFVDGNGDGSILGDFGAAEFQEEPVARAFFWTEDSDGDSIPDGLEFSTGTDMLLPDSTSQRNLSITPSGNGTGTVAFAVNPDALGKAEWVVTRSVDLEEFAEIYRSSDPDVTDGFVRFEDTIDSANNDAFYKLEVIQLGALE